VYKSEDGKEWEMLTSVPLEKYGDMYGVRVTSDSLSLFSLEYLDRSCGCLLNQSVCGEETFNSTICACV
jgi:hypothetical protein